MTGRTRRGDRTRTQLLDAARQVLIEHGPDAFSLREVARRASLAPSAVYNHFAGREGLVTALAMEAIEVLGSYLEAVSTTLPAPQRLSSLAEEYLRFAAEQPDRYRLAFDLLEAPTRSWAQYASVAYPFTVIVRAVEDGLAEGGLRDEPSLGAPALAYGLWSLVHGMVLLSAHHLALMSDDLSQNRHAAVAAYIRGISTSPDAGEERP